MTTAVGCTPPPSVREMPAAVAGAALVSLYSTYLPGSGEDTVRAIAAGTDGRLAVVGGTASRDFPVSLDAWDTSYNGTHDAFITLFNADGTVAWSTFLGGPGFDRAYAVTIDLDGSVVVAGRAGPGFPVTAGAVQTEFVGGSAIPQGETAERRFREQDGFVAKFSPDGALVWATYFGGADGRPVRDVDVDHRGDVYLVASDESGQFSTAIAGAFSTGWQPSPAGGRGGDLVIARLSRDGSRVLWATYLGGRNEDGDSPSIRVGPDHSVYVLTSSLSDDLPASPAAFSRRRRGRTDFFLARLSADGSRLFSGTYLGGSGVDATEAHGLAVTSDGRAVVVGMTLSADYPTTSGVVQSTYGGTGDAGRGLDSNYPGDIVVSVVSADGTRLLASTFLGGRYGDGAEGVALDSRGDIWVTGSSASPDFPVTPDAIARQRGVRFDMVAAKLPIDLSRLFYSTYLGGDLEDFGRGAAASPDGRYYIAGAVRSDNWPLLAPAHPRFLGYQDGAIVGFRLP